MPGRYYSRRIQTEKRKNHKRAVWLIFLTGVIMIFFFFWGLPTIIKLASFIADFRSSSSPIGSSDSTPPAPPELDQLAKSTNDTSIDIKGSSEAGSTVVLLLDSQVAETLANAEGRFSYTFQLNDGENRISAYAKDTSGNQSGNSHTQVVVFDDDPPELSLTSPSNGDKFFANDNQVDVAGTVDEEAKVTINGSFVIVGPDGDFTRKISLNEGVNEITVKSEDDAGNVSETSISLEYIK